MDNNQRIEKIDKVVWLEGMLLAPQHFQQQEKYLEALLQENFLVGGKHDCYGVEFIRIKEEYLINHIISLECFNIVLPHGICISSPYKHMLPEAIKVNIQDGFQTVYLGIYRENNQRYIPYEAELIDQADPNNISTIKAPLAKLNVKLLTESDDLCNYICIPILQITTSKYGIEISKNYIPPILYINSSKTLMDLLEGCIQLILHNQLQLQMQIAHGNYNVNVKKVMVLQVINKYLSTMDFFYNYKHIKPLQILLVLCQFIAELSTLIDNRLYALQQFQYKHDDLFGCFDNAKNALNLLLAKIQSFCSREIILSQDQNKIYNADLILPWEILDSNFILEFNLSGSRQFEDPNELIRKIKIDSPEYIHNIIRSQVIGIPLCILDSIPENIPNDSQSIYFSLSRDQQITAAWNRINITKKIAVHIDDIYSGLIVKLWVVPNNV